jgi:hypothetical protein
MWISFHRKRYIKGTGRMWNNATKVAWYILKGQAGHAIMYDTLYTQCVGRAWYLLKGRVGKIHYEGEGGGMTYNIETTSEVLEHFIQLIDSMRCITELQFHKTTSCELFKLWWYPSLRSASATPILRPSTYNDDFLRDKYGFLHKHEISEIASAFNFGSEWSQLIYGLGLQNLFYLWL